MHFFSKYFIYILLILTTNIDAQNKPKFDPKKPHKTVYTGFNTLQGRVNNMKTNFAKYCIRGENYCNAFANFNIKEQLTVIDKYYANYNGIFTIKMTDNSVFVFLFSNICNFDGEETGEVNVTFFNYTYGDVDKGSIKNFLIKKKRVLVENNQFTEELKVGNFVFTIYDKRYFMGVKFSGNDIIINEFKGN